MSSFMRSLSRSRSRGGAHDSGDSRGRSAERRADGGDDSPATGSEDGSRGRTGRRPSIAQRLSSSISRQPISENGEHKHFHATGRGGAGNIQLGDAKQGAGGEADESPEAVREARDAVARTLPEHGVRPTGRGGSGNMTSSRSRSRSRDPATRTAADADHHQLNRVTSGQLGPVHDEEEIKAMQEDAIARDRYLREKEQTTTYFASGRGGAGNISVRRPVNPIGGMAA